MKLAFKLMALFLCGTLTACGGGGGGGDCNPSAGSFCGEGQYCAFFDGGCGLTGGSGSCASIPASCPADAGTVCTCENISFDNECFAAAAGLSVKAPGECS